MADNKLQASLREAVRMCPIGEKILVVNDLDAGRALVHHLVLTGTPYVNLHLSTPHMLALELARPQLEASGFRPASRVALALLVEDLVTQADSNGALRAYLGQVPHTVGLVETLQRSVRDLRLAGLTAQTLPVDAFETHGKGAAVQELLAAYEHALRERGLADEAAVYHMALTAVPQEPERHYLLPANLEVTKGLEQQFLDAITAERAHVLACDELSTTEAEHLPKVTLFHATGPYNEVRGVARRLLDARQSFGDVELVMTDTATYTLAIRDVLTGLGIPATFARGIPVTSTLPGRALQVVLTWLQDGFRAATLAQAVGAGLLYVPGALPGQGGSLSRMLKESPIGWGRDRYAPTLAAMESALADKLERLTSRSSADEEDNGTDRRAALQRQLEHVLLLKNWVSDLLKWLPAADANGHVWLADHCRGLAQALTRSVPEAEAASLNAMAKERLLGLLGETAEHSTGSYPLAEVAQRVQLLLEGASAGESGPLPGHVHVTDLAGAGWAGRTAVFVVGLDAERFPGASLQDPILLDRERSALSGALTLSTDRLAQKRLEFRNLVAGVRGMLTGSYSTIDPAQDRAGFPSPALLELERIRTGSESVDYTALLQSLGTPEGYVPPAGAGALDAQDWWLARLTEENGRTRDGRASVLAAHPQLDQGLQAEISREQAALTSYDGWVGPDAALDLRNRDTVISPSRLEALARCARKYFFQYALGIAPSEEIVFDPTRWLDPLQRGSLLHQVFYEFLKGLRDEGIGRPKPEHAERLRTIAEGCIQAQRQEVPPPSEPVFAAERAELLRSVDLFLRIEADPAAKGTPYLFEVGFGTPTAPDTGEMGLREPVPIKAASGREIRVRGRIDRIDSLGDHRYAIWDYKTGSSSKYRDEAYFAAGEQIQHALYAAAAEAILRQTGRDPQAVVAEAGYLFPTERGEGRRVSRVQNRREEMARLLDDLADVAQQGLFVATADESECQWCEYTRACGAVRAVAQTKEKQAAPELEPVRRVASYE